MPKKLYRADIDGLRAIAVLGVVFFHAGFSLPGGYIGVDVFFVISGFLITQIILRESQENRFSLKQFWIRRIRRILPASAVVTICTLGVGYFILDSSSFILLAKAGVAHSLMLSNVFFWKSSWYFSESTELQPLLHTWSLSVEEQFYLVFPILLSLLLPKTRSTFVILVIVGLFSLFLSSVGVHARPAASFYLLPTRAWELTAGALLAMKGARFVIKGVVKELCAFIGLIAIIIPMVLYSDSTPFPGIAAIPPVLGTVLLIATGGGAGTMLSRAISSKLIVGIGLASYSIYLWHWPILVFLKHSLIEPSLYSKTFALVLTALLSYISWRFVEIPFRKSKRFSSAKIAFSFGIITTSVIAITSLSIYFLQGLPSRFDKKLTTIQEDITWNGSTYIGADDSGVPIGATEDTFRPFDFALWGDSHGMASTDIIDTIAKETNLKGVALLSSGRPPITGLWKPFKGPERQKETTKINKKRFQWIIDNGISDVILIGRWRGMFQGLVDTEINQREGKPLEYSMVTDSPNIAPSTETSKEAFIRQFGQMHKAFTEKGVRLWILLQVPTSTRPTVARDFYIHCRFPFLNPQDFRLDTSQKAYEENRLLELQIFSSFQGAYCQLIDPLDSFYSKYQEHLELYSERAHYRDEDHLTRHGADLFLRAKFSKVLSQIKSDGLKN